MITHEDAITRFIVANGTKLAYRRLGRKEGVPLVMMMLHFRGNIDFWDPALIDALGESRPIILMDNSGIEKSEGQIPTTPHGWAVHLIGLLEVLNIRQIDLLGYWVGGGAAQHVALAAPQGLVCKLATGKTVLERIYVRKQDRTPHLPQKLAKRQTDAFKNFSISSPDNPYERVRELKMPVVDANGDNDLLIPTVDSVKLAELLPNARLHIYPNSGHGFLYQYAELFAKHIDLFLDGSDEEGEKPFKSRLSLEERWDSSIFLKATVFLLFF
ncbi:hypothetical protein EG329_013395 [Mollisiaceae sp. DMI_Dod_QoI]|nr:hypothetical protein EG329_013395 [Helotiales sp. DMI_Dod_QoI]